MEPRYFKSSPKDIRDLLRYYPSAPLSNGVRVNMVTSLDGGVAVQGRSQGLSSTLDKIIFKLLRATSFAVVVGAKTALVEKYGPPRLTPELKVLRKSLGLENPPFLVVVGSMKGDLSWVNQVRDIANPTVLCLRGLTADHDFGEGLLNGVTHFGKIDLPHVTRSLLQVADSPILCEGGPAIVTELANNSLIDELCISIAHTYLGKSLTPIFGGLQEPLRLSSQSDLSDGTHHYFRYKVEK